MSVLLQPTKRPWHATQGDEPSWTRDCPGGEEGVCVKGTYRTGKGGEEWKITHAHNDVVDVGTKLYLLRRFAPPMDLSSVELLFIAASALIHVRLFTFTTAISAAFSRRKLKRHRIKRRKSYFFRAFRNHTSSNNITNMSACLLDRLANQLKSDHILHPVRPQEFKIPNSKRYVVGKKS